MAKRRRLTKEDDYETWFSCAGGIGILREEAWADETGEIVRYNLAFIVPHLFRADNGRILGFDNAHGTHERHFFGEVSPVEYKGYEAVAEQFYREVKEWRQEHEDKNFQRRI